MAGTVGELIDELSSRVSAVDNLRTAHRRYFGEVLPHVLFGDITRWAELHATSDCPRDVREVLAVLEAAWQRGDDDVRNLIAVSFLENLSEDSTVVPMLESGLASEFRQHS